MDIEPSMAEPTAGSTGRRTLARALVSWQRDGHFALSDVLIVGPGIRAGFYILQRYSKLRA